MDFVPDHDDVVLDMKYDFYGNRLGTSRIVCCRTTAVVSNTRSS